MEYENDDRYATTRSSYLARQTELRGTEAEAIALSELGYSNSGIARRMDTSESTVSSWKQKAIALYGLEISHPLMPDQNPPNYEQVSPTYLDELEPQERRIVWLEAVVKNSNKLQKEWVHSVLDYAEENYRSELKEAGGLGLV